MRLVLINTFTVRLVLINTFTVRLVLIYSYSVTNSANAVFVDTELVPVALEEFTPILVFG